MKIKKETVKLGSVEIQILEVLKNNAREKIVNIGKQLNISSGLVLYKLRKLMNEGIILGTRIHFNMVILGYFYTVLLININNLSEENLVKFKKITEGDPYVSSFGVMFGNPNIFIQLFHRDEREVRDLMKQ